MSAPVKAWVSQGLVFLRSANCGLDKGLLNRKANNFPRALGNHQITRGRKRSTRHPSWFVPQQPSETDEDLTAENQEYISELVQARYAQQKSPLKDGPWERGVWTRSTRRTGVLALKIGVLPQWTKEGHKFYTTLLQVLDNHVIRYNPPEVVRNSFGWQPYWGTKYGIVVVGALSCDPHEFSKEYNNLFSEACVPPKRRLTRFLVTPEAAIQPGTPLNATHYRVGDVVDVQAKTIDHGFQGVIKRWGMKGMPKTHGTTKSHRKMGSAAGTGTKGSIWKGKRMPGHMGADWRALRGLTIHRINYRYNVLYVTGPCLPGPNHAYVRVMDTVLPRRKNSDSPPLMPTCYPEDLEGPLPEEAFHDDLFQFTEPSIAYKEDKK
ncbi:large ribosomal subunit protein uL3m-like [Liolophura sinensis]|uniref:large ribosomal subunit protein uL3m-like n=1 Tax=Liolophura sinensis TaxID=3198878 RepID=UPI0031583B15